MNTEDLFFGSIKKVEISPMDPKTDDDFTKHLKYTFLKKQKDGRYKDIQSIFGKKYKTNYENIGDKFVDLNQLVPYSELKMINRPKTNKPRKELLQELLKIRKIMLEEVKEITSEKFFVGYLCQVISATSIPGTGTTILEQFLTTEVECQCLRIKKTLFFEEDYGQYIDLDSGKSYKNYGCNIGNIFVDTNHNFIPWNLYLPKEERSTTTTKRKALTRFKEMKNKH